MCSARPTSSDNTFQPDNVAVVKLPQGEGLSQETEPLGVGATIPQGVHSHRQFLATRQLQAATAQVSKSSCEERAAKTPRQQMEEETLGLGSFPACCGKSQSSNPSLLSTSNIALRFISFFPLGLSFLLCNRE